MGTSEAAASSGDEVDDQVAEISGVEGTSTPAKSSRDERGGKGDELRGRAQRRWGQAPYMTKQTFFF